MISYQPFKQIYYLAPNNTKLYFFEGRTRALQSWQNFGMPNINFIEDRGPNQHGTTVRDWRAQTRAITLEWFGQNCYGRQCEYATVIEKIRPTHDNSPGYLRVINQDTSLLEIPAWIRQGPSGNWSVDSGLRNLQVRDALQFHCADPIWRKVQQETVSIEIGISDSCLPMCLPACLGNGLLSAELEICYNGTWPGDQITFTLTGPLDTPTIINETTGRIIELNYNIPVNDIVTITILPESVTVTSLINGNIIGTVTNISDLVFFTLAPRQINVITFGGANGIEGSSGISMSYYTRYLSVYDPCSDSDCAEQLVESRFVTRWQTDNEDGETADNQIQLPLVSSGNYNFIVDWGDGGNQDSITTWDQAQTLHTYASPGTYTVTINGTCEGWSFNGAGDGPKLINISQWGSGFRLGNDGNYFDGCFNVQLSATDVLNLAGTTTLEAMFKNCFQLIQNSAMNTWDVSSITNMSGMFTNAVSFNQNLNGWNVSNVTNMSDMFFGAAVFNQNITSWNVSSVTNMSGTFSNANAFNQNISSWNVSNVTTMNAMFVGTAFNQDISSWDVSSVTTMNGMFFGAVVFDQDIGSWDVGSVTDMSGMFDGVTLSLANYNALLIGWEGLSPSLQNGVTFDGGNSQYSAGAAATARANLIANHTWSITDGGQI